jgi:hypothetical protein
MKNMITSNNNNGSGLRVIRFMEDAIEMTTIMYLQSIWDHDTLNGFNALKMSGLGFSLGPRSALSNDIWDVLQRGWLKGMCQYVVMVMLSQESQHNQDTHIGSSKQSDCIINKLVGVLE